MSNVLICSDALLREVYFQIDAELPLKKYMLKVFLQVIVLRKKKMTLCCCQLCSVLQKISTCIV